MRILVAIVALLALALSACVKDQPPGTGQGPSTGQAPSIEVVGLTQGTAVGGAFTLQIKADDDQGLSAVEYAVGDGAFAPMRLDTASGLFEVSIDTKALGEGSLSITVRAIDKTGQAVQASTSVMVDNLAPTLQIIGPAEGMPVSGMLTLQVEASDDQGLEALEYEVGDGAFAPMSLNSGTGRYEASIDSKSLKGGKHSLTVRAKDSAGNTAQALLDMTVDNQAPTLQIIGPAEGTPVRGMLTLQVEASDDMGLEALEYEVGNGAFARLKLNTETGRYEASIDSKTIEGGKRSLTVRAKDSAGNTARAAVAITVDNQAPTLRIVSPRDEALASGMLTLQARAEDDMELMAVEYTLDGELFRPLSLNSAEGVYEAAIDTKDMKGGKQSLTIRATDGAGNTAQAPLAITVDNQAPTLRIVGPADGAALQGKVTLQVQASDDVALMSVEYTLDGEDFRPLKLDDTKSMYEAAFDTSALKGGSHSVAVRATDGAGHAAEVSASIKVDNEAPSLRIVGPADGAMLQGKITLQVQAGDDLALSAVEYSLDGKTFLPLSPNDKEGMYEAAIDTKDMKPGSQTITVRAVDGLGHTTEAKTGIRVDGPPSLTILSPEDGTTLQSGALLRVQASDDVGLSAVEYSVDGGTFWPLSGDSAGYFSLFGMTMPNGRHSIIIRATDSNGNVVEMKTSFTMSAPPPPPPQPPVIITGGGGNPPPPVDNPPSVTIVSPAAGAALQGSVILQVQASDDKGLSTVEFAIDGGAFAPMTFNAAQGRYEATINAAALAVGSHTINVRATDTAAHTTLRQVSGTVATDTLGPALTMVNPSPATPQVLGGSATLLKVNASDASGVGGVQWQVMDPPLSAPNEAAWQPMVLNPTTSQWEALWQVPGVAADATKILVVRATDAQQNISLSDFVIVVSTVQIGPGFALGALEIFALPPGGDVVPPTLHSNPRNDTTPLPAGVLPAGTISLVVLPGATVTALNPNGEWVLDVGGQTVFVYESAATGKDIVPVGSVVRVVATRTLVAGPIVAEVIRLRPTARAEIVYAFLYSGTVTSADAVKWTVGGVDFLIATPDPNIGPAAIDPGLGVGSLVQVEFSQAPDVTPPSVSVTSPAGGTQISGLVTLSASASDNLAMAQVRFLVDGNLIATDATTPYSLAWDSAPMLDGASHIITAQAMDAAGNMASASISVTTPDRLGPSVNITSPASGTTVVGTVTLSADATDLGGVTQVRFRVDGALLSTDTAAPYSVDWDTTSLADGQHTLTVEAVDTPGNVGSASVTVTVDNTAPTINITSPASGALVGGTVTVSANVTDPGGIAQVQFLVNGVLFGTDTAAPYSVAWNTASLADGQHTVTVEATDTLGHLGSASVTVTVDNAAPTVTITAPAASATVNGTITISADAADGQGVIEVRFLVDGVLLGTKAAAPFSAAWDTLTVANGQHTVTVEARDAAGNVGSASVNVTVQN